MKNRTNIRYLVQLSLLAAIELVMAYTPLGYFRTLGLEISFLMVPVALGAILLGPGAGAVLGAIFGLTSFGTCFSTSAFGAVLLSINPLFTFITSVCTRILAGWLTGVVFRRLSAWQAPQGSVHLLPLGVAALCGPLFNTVFFMTALVAFFYRTDFIQQIATSLGSANPFTFVLLFVGVQGLIEALVGCFVTTALGKAMFAYMHANRSQTA
jgi:uncharacterized membrane protein